jgi:asparagine synthase (glutamine-hydrolysing)
MCGFVGLTSLDGRTIKRELFSSIKADLSLPSEFSQDEFLSTDLRTAIARIHKGILQNGPQPALSDDCKVAVLLEGEVFNEDFDLGNQPQSILSAYLEEGDSLFTRLNGSFCLIIVHSTPPCLKIVADRFATIPLYYTRKRDYLSFSGEIRPLLRVLGDEAKVNPLAVENYLAVGFILDGQTLLNGVKCLRPGEMLSVEDGQMKVERYWQFAFTEQRDERQQSELEEELSWLCARAVQRQTKGDYQIAIPLSGGYDSRSLQYYWLQTNGHQPFPTISWGATEDKPRTDAWVARLLSCHLRTDHTFYPLQPGELVNHFEDFITLDEGRTDAITNYPRALKVLNDIRERLDVDILLRGNEIFGVQKRVYRENDARHYAHTDDLSFFPYSFQYLETDVYKNLLDMGVEQARHIQESCPHADPIDIKDWLYVAQRYSGYQSPLTGIKRRVIEERNPFLDNDIVDFVSRLPADYRISKALFKATMRNQMPGFTSVEFARKDSLVDWDSQIVSDTRLQSLINHVLFEKQNEFDAILNQGRLRQFVQNSFRTKTNRPKTLITRTNRRLQERMDRYTINPSTEIFRLMILKLWTDEFLNGEFSLGC